MRNAVVAKRNHITMLLAQHMILPASRLINLHSWQEHSWQSLLYFRGSKQTWKPEFDLGIDIGRLLKQNCAPIFTIQQRHPSSLLSV